MSKKTTIASDVRYIREELSLTAHSIALSLVKRTGSPDVLAKVAEDLEKVADRLREMSKHKSR